MEKQTAIGALAALAHETRLDVFRRLVRGGPDGLAAGEVGEALGIPAATLSFHLKELKGAGLVRCERAGRSRIYSADLGAVRALVEFLTESCCQGFGARRRAGGSKGAARRRPTHSKEGRA
ncbi:MAG: helix-turn-helix transcriptional regulator [Deltaproteobacteria bacterium]|nr:MAG: helix-turn-helix transcriptional regulator [Deltaproteobacteria bacterium]